jgi:hypothetical protein
MVLPPPCRGNSVAHLRIPSKEATCPHTISLGLIQGTLSKKKEHNIVSNPNFMLVCFQYYVSCIFMHISMVML